MSEEKRTISTLDIHEIMQTLPHRYPFLLVDKVTDYSVGEYLQAVKKCHL